MPDLLDAAIRSQARIEGAVMFGLIQSPGRVLPLFARFKFQPLVNTVARELLAFLIAQPVGTPIDEAAITWLMMDANRRRQFWTWYADFEAVGGDGFARRTWILLKNLDAIRQAPAALAAMASLETTR